ncbi:hypothetical protein TNIN_126011 [Trichonephila inaurata madagascariensis]|uniref:Uncharacterized protein n=1 Tax=Trichonephila inaurata madagascariensis TaxID=2747483 RepID=A0A8X6Y3G6_9ARAC|nr:hypothetical protein TNIN_126011 [Trichonephila inaurata madagascariensis]
MILVHGKLNADSYSSILDNNVPPMLWEVYGLEHCYLKDDNAPFHLRDPSEIGMMTMDYTGLPRVQT